MQLIIGAPMEGGFFAGKIRVYDKNYALIVSPKAEGDHEDIMWNKDYNNVDNAKSYENGLANTLAMADAGSELAKWAIDLRIGGFDDWYIPSQDELEIIYRNLKPTTDKNYCWARSGINLSAIEPTRPYSPDSPIQTTVPLFQQGGEQALEPTWYWSSTQHVSDSDYAWYQFFSYGNQDDDTKDCNFRARAVRRSPI
jgi:hypothetical protein